MIKVIDVDSLFDKFISDYVYSSVGKISPEEIENNIPKLYNDFGKAKLDDLGGKSPEEYYANATSTELLECLKNHLNELVPVPDFLCEALVKKDDAEKEICSAFSLDNDEQFTVYLMNMLGELNSKKAFSHYLELILGDYSETLRELATELLHDGADEVKEQILEAFDSLGEEKKACLTEVLSHCKFDDRVFAILTSEFLLHLDNIPLYAGHLGKYGDNRAIPMLSECIQNENISYADFEELRFAIENLGGEYTGKTPTFKNDKTYKQIKNTKTK